MADQKGFVGQQGPIHSEQASSVLLETITLLKDSGNSALKSGLPGLAARRYDKALQYCASAFMDYPQPTAGFAFALAVSPANLSYTWNPLLKRLVAIRLNLALVLLKHPLRDREKSAEQAMIALLELDPFGTERGKVRKGKDLEVVVEENEQESTFKEAREFMAKAFFRLAAAQSEMADHQEAARNYDRSIKFAKSVDPKRKPDQLVLRRLADAKRESMKQSKRQRKKFKGMFASSVASRSESNSTDGDS